MVTAKQPVSSRANTRCQVTVCYIDVRHLEKERRNSTKSPEERVFYRKGIPSESITDRKLIVKAEDELLAEPYEEEADLVVLATGSSEDDGEHLRNVLKLSEDPTLLLEPIQN